MTTKPQLKARKIPFGVKPIANVINVVACASGKGGVGKSTTTVALAYTLQRQGWRVGILDCDIHGPNIGSLLGAEVDLEQHDILDPVTVDGIATQSIAYWVKSDAALAWRGPMITKALLQMAYQTRWPQLDILLLDMPPETGDIALSICKRLPLCAAFMVTTSNHMALADLARAVSLFAKCQVPVLGAVENMHVANAKFCAADWLQQRQLALLGQVPFSSDLHSGWQIGDTVAQAELADIYQQIVAAMLAGLESLPRDYSAAFGTIQVNGEEK